MPYKHIKELPESVQSVLPKEAQQVYLKTFNSALEQFKDPKEWHKKASPQEAAHKAAWAAVMKDYRKDPDTGRWHSKKEVRSGHR